MGGLQQSDLSSSLPVQLNSATIMLEQLAVARRAIEHGQEMVTDWRIETAEGAFSIRTQFDTDNSEQRRQNDSFN